MDTAIEILNWFYVREKGVWKLKVMWWRKGGVNPPQPMGFTQKMTVTRDKMLEFTPYDPASWQEGRSANRPFIPTDDF